MNVHYTAIDGLAVIEPTIFEDQRGYFFESYNERKLAKAMGQSLPRFVQDNQSKSRHGVLRGLHFQTAPHGQAKLIRAITGEIFDVAVDLRPGSPTYGHWHGERLSAENRRQFFVPKGFAHGFVVLSEVAEILYKCDAFYAPESEGALHYNDPEVAIDWPLPEEALTLSEKDQNGARLKELTDLRF